MNKHNQHLMLSGMLCLSGIFGACRREITPADTAPRTDTFMTAPSSNAYNVNVIYFVPSDGDTIVNYRARLNGVLRHGQAFYNKWMSYHGFGDRTFGLTSDSSGRVKVIVVRGNLTKDQYPYEGGGNKVITEMNTWFAAHPTEKSSEHTLVIMPASTYAADGDPGGVPFYGLGRWCFALDYAEMDTSYLGQNNTLGNRATKWIGGLMHELGHGINLPHNKEKVSEGANPAMGTALMGSGNYTYGKTATFLTKASAAILNNCQVFRATTATDIYGGGSATINTLKASYSSGNINLKVKYTATKTVNNVIVYHDREDGADYDAVAWTAVPAGDSIQLSMPISEIQNKTNNYKLRIRFLFTNGSSAEKSYSYSYSGGLPVLDIDTKDELSKTGWTINYVNSQENDGAAANLLDNNPSTIWHTQWKSTQPAHPHTVIVDMQSSKSIAGLSFLQRENLNGSLKDITIHTSADNITYTSQGAHTLQNVNTIQYKTFTSVVNCRYIKIVTASNYSGSHYAVLAELGAF